MNMNKNSNWVYGYHALRAAFATHADSLDALYLQAGRVDKRIDSIKLLAKEHGVVLNTLSAKSLQSLLGDGVVHQGMAASCNSPIDLVEADLPLLLAAQKTPVVLILDCIQDPHNLGACLRCANAFDVCAVIAPKDRSVAINPTVKKVACGAADLTPFIQVTNLARTLKQLQADGLWLIGTDDIATENISQVDMTGPIGIVMGNEGHGMRRLVRERCDFLARIELPGDVSSVNVSVATGICLYEVQRQRSAIVNP